jgi:hypothetical protein
MGYNVHTSEKKPLLVSSNVTRVSLFLHAFDHDESNDALRRRIYLCMSQSLEGNGMPGSKEPVTFFFHASYVG